ncbi:MAG TPA: FAD/NAD(P)-binding protein [Steroidobacteraceae bacterium]
MRSVILIVGAGFSGTVFAVNLLRHLDAAPVDIYLVERGPDLGRGIAYARRSFPFLLNVPAARLSADPNDPLQFLRFAQRLRPEVGAEDFLPREIYGDYLGDLLEEARKEARNSTLHVVKDEVVDIRRAGKGALSVHFANRESLRAAAVVLASGNPPASWLAWADRLKDHPAVRDNPWELPADIGKDHTVFIVGNGLTMADVAMALGSKPDNTPLMLSMSRRGLLPQPQTEFRSLSLDGHGERLLAASHSLRRLLRVSREIADEVQREGGDWREAVTHMRAFVPQLWQKLPLSERARFLRHVQPHWDTHRHRLPPEVARRVRELRERGRLKVHAGRVQSAVAQGQKLRISWQSRGAKHMHSALVDYAINASGPDYVLERSREPLIHSLRAQGLIAGDALRLGIRTSPESACIDTFGQTSSNLYYVGPLLRAEHWEATAATELRDHAVRLARQLSERLRAVQPV